MAGTSNTVIGTGRWGATVGKPSAEPVYTGADVSDIAPTIEDLSAQLAAQASMDAYRIPLTIDNATGKVIQPKVQNATLGGNWLNQLLAGNGKWVVLAVGIGVGLYLWKKSED